MTVRELEETMDTSELLEWAALAKTEPLGLERLEALVAQLCALVYNAHRPKHARAATAAEYMPWTADRPADGGVAASAAAFQVLAATGKR